MAFMFDDIAVCGQMEVGAGARLLAPECRPTPSRPHRRLRPVDREREPGRAHHEPLR